MIRLLSFVLLVMSQVMGVASASVRIDGVRAWAAPDSTRVVFDISAPLDHRVTVLHDPERVVVDLVDVTEPPALHALNVEGSFYKGVRAALHEQSTFRVVFDLDARVRPKSFLLKPNERYGHRLVIDFFREAASGATTQAPSTAAPGAITQSLRDVIIAIDAGHGGEDPGAIGTEGAREKDIVLAIAQRLNSMVGSEPGMKPVMIRTGDYFVSLGGRRQLAQQHRADMFVSIHADSFLKNPNARGVSVYAVSAKGASSAAAKYLADSENATDLIGGVSFEDKDDMLTSVLLDLSQSGTIEASIDFGSRVLLELGKVGSVHKRKVEQAGFVVLKSLGIPSLLVESGFISNRKEEYKLRDPMYQELIANSVLRGIRSYFADHAPPDTTLSVASAQHVIAPGESLSLIAQRYKVSVPALRRLNDLPGETLEAGRILRIPKFD